MITASPTASTMSRRSFFFVTSTDTHRFDCFRSMVSRILRAAAFLAKLPTRLPYGCNEVLACEDAVICSVLGSMRWDEDQRREIVERGKGKGTVDLIGARVREKQGFSEVKKVQTWTGNIRLQAPPIACCSNAARHTDLASQSPLTLELLHRHAARCSLDLSTGPSALAHAVSVMLPYLSCTCLSCHAPGQSLFHGITRTRLERALHVDMPKPMCELGVIRPS